MRNRKIVNLTAGLVFLSAGIALAESPFKADASLRDNLKALAAAKKPVTVILESGTTYQAIVGEVGDHVVVLTEPQGKSFFDVLVPIDAIAAVEARARDK